jgi:hypothetical protein
MRISSSGEAKGVWRAGYHPVDAWILDVSAGKYGLSLNSKWTNILIEITWFLRGITLNDQMELVGRVKWRGAGESSSRSAEPLARHSPTYQPSVIYARNEHRAQTICNRVVSRSEMWAINLSSTNNQKRREILI